jgi:hypothetical protein
MNYLTQTLAALAAAAVLAACGGGAAETTALAALLPAPGSAEDTPSHVPVQGCVADAHGGVPALVVHATGEDGRLLASTTSDADGVFRLQVPARRVVRFAAATPGVDALTVLTGASPLAMGGCLRAAA